MKSFRDLPWRSTSNPYYIYLSEIILQQTRVEQGLPYFLSFQEQFPTVQALAEASEDEVLALWQGLGYYSRARNMHATAKTIASTYKGKFPSSYDELLKLKGVGPYTAAAIASFAFNIPKAVIDGNVERVISRYFGIQEDVRSAAGKEEIATALESVFDQKHPANFNQAIMELGSLVCSPKQFKCEACPLAAGCQARAHQWQERLPYKPKKTKVIDVHFNYLVFFNNDKSWIEQRTEGLWQKLYQFPLVEGEQSASDMMNFASNFLKTRGKIHMEKSFETTHVLSHRRIKAHFYIFTSEQKFESSKSAIFEIALDQLGKRYPAPVLITKFLKHYLENGK